jgi:hypothetical protein
MLWNAQRGNEVIPVLEPGSSHADPAIRFFDSPILRDVRALTGLHRLVPLIG